MKVKKIATSIRLVPDVHEWYKAEAERMGMSMNSYFAYILNKFKEEKEGKK